MTPSPTASTHRDASRNTLSQRRTRARQKAYITSLEITIQNHARQLQQVRKVIQAAMLEERRESCNHQLNALLQDLGIIAPPVYQKKRTYPQVDSEERVSAMRASPRTKEPAAASNSTPSSSKTQATAFLPSSSPSLFRTSSNTPPSPPSQPSAPPFSIEAEAPPRRPTPPSLPTSKSPPSPKPETHSTHITPPPSPACRSLLSSSTTPCARAASILVPSSTTPCARAASILSSLRHHPPPHTEHEICEELSCTPPPSSPPATCQISNVRVMELMMQ